MNQRALVHATIFAFSFCSVQTLLVAIVRSGLGTPIDYLLTPVIFVVSLFTAPLVIRYHKLIPRCHNTTAIDSSVLGLVFLLVIPLSFFGTSALYVFYILAIFGAISFVSQIKGLSFEKYELLTTVVVGGFLGFYSGTWTSAYFPESLFYEAGLDSLFHLALINMWDKHHVVSLGLDGLTPLTYHAGAHIWLASFSRVSGVTTEWILGVGAKLIFPALFYASVFYATGVIASQRKIFNPTVILTNGLAMLLLQQLGWRTYLESESYTISLFFLMLLLPHVFSFYENSQKKLHREFFVVAIFFGALMAFIKISTAVIFFAVLAYIEICRLFRDQNLRFLLGGFLLLLILIAVFFVLASQRLQEMFYPLALFRSFFWDGALSNMIVPVFVLMVVRCSRNENIDSHSDVYRTKHELITSQAIIVGLVAASLPGLLLEIPGGAAYFFLNTMQWVALPIALSYICRTNIYRSSLYGTRGKLSLSLVAALSISIVLVVVVEKMPNPVSVIRGFVERVDKGHVGTGFLDQFKAKNIYVNLFGRNILIGHLDEVSQYLLTSVANEGVFLGETIPEKIRLTSKYRLSKSVRNIAGSDINDILVYVPPDNDLFWEGYQRCPSKAFFVPAVLALPSLSGLPAVDTTCGQEIIKGYKRWRGGQYGYRDYGEGSHNKAFETADHLCTRAKELGFTRVMIIRDFNNIEKNVVTECE